MYKMLKEETASCNNLELMKLVEKYSRWIFSVWEFSKGGGGFPVGQWGNLMDENLSSGNFTGENFPRTLHQTNYQYT